MDEDENLLYVERITTSKDGQTEDDRLMFISHRIAEICVMNRAHESAMEDQHGGLNQKTAMQLSRARGAAMMAMRYVGCSTEYYAASTVKFGLVTGVKVFYPDGRFKKMEITKEMIAEFVQNEYPWLQDLIGPFTDKDGDKKTSDIYDAVAIVKHHVRKRKLGL